MSSNREKKELIEKQLRAEVKRQQRTALRRESAVSGAVKYIKKKPSNKKNKNAESATQSKKKSWENVEMLDEDASLYLFRDYEEDVFDSVDGSGKKKSTQSSSSSSSSTVDEYGKDENEFLKKAEQLLDEDFRSDGSVIKSAEHLHLHDSYNRSIVLLGSKKTNETDTNVEGKAETSSDEGSVDGMDESSSDDENLEEMIVELHAPLRSTMSFLDFARKQQDVEDQQRERIITAKKQLDILEEESSTSSEASTSDGRRAQNSTLGKRRAETALEREDKGKGERALALQEASWHLSPEKVMRWLTNTCVPYWESLLTEAQKKAMQMNRSTSSHLCPRKHVARVLFEKYGPFRSCINGTACECYSNWGFVMMEYLSPKEFDLAIKNNKVCTINTNFCYICLLCAINQQFLQNHSLQNNCTTIKLEFYHAQNIIGEYKRSAMLPSIISVFDEAAATPNIITSANENCYGLTKPVRAFVVSQYSVKPSTTVMLADGKQVQVQSLVESSQWFYDIQEHSRTPLPKVRPYTTVTLKTVEYKETNELLLERFTPGSNYGVAFGRLRFIPKAKSSEKKRKNKGKEPASAAAAECISTAPDEKMILSSYWAHDNKGRFKKDKPNGFIPMPWELIFCKDICKTADGLETVLSGGRIDLSRLDVRDPINNQVKRRIVLNLKVDFEKELSYFSSQTDDPRYRDKRIVTSMEIRIAIMRTLHVMYPNSHTALIDERVHALLDIMIKWNVEYMNALLEIDPDGPRDEDIPKELLQSLAEREIPRSVYPEDRYFLVHETEVTSRPTPVEELADLFVVTQKDLCRWLFCDFEMARKHLFEETYDEALRELWDKCTPHFAIGCEKRIDMCSVSEWRSKYSIVITMLLRVNYSYSMQVEEEEHLTVATEVCTKKEEELLSLANSEDQTQWYGERIKQCKLDYNKHKKTMDAIQHKCYILRMFAYTHLALAQRMLDMRICEDSQLEQICERNNRQNECSFSSHYDEVYPWDTRCPTEGMLPDLSVLLSCAVFIDNKATEGRDPQSFLKMVRKLLPRTWQVRTNHLTHMNVCEDSLSYMDLSVQALELFMLGGYEHARHAPRFLEAISIYRWLGTHHDREEFLEWQKSHGQLMVCAMREMLVFLTSLFQPYERHIVNVYPSYLSFKKKVLCSADMCRSYLHASKNTSDLENLIHLTWEISRQNSTSSGEQEATHSREERIAMEKEEELELCNDYKRYERVLFSENSSLPTMPYDVNNAEQQQQQQQQQQTLTQLQKDEQVCSFLGNEITEHRLALGMMEKKRQDLNAIFYNVSSSKNEKERIEKELLSLKAEKRQLCINLEKLIAQLWAMENAQRLEYVTRHTPVIVYHNVFMDPLRCLCDHIRAVNVLREEKGYLRTEMPTLMRDCIIERVKAVEPTGNVDISVLEEFNFGVSKYAYNANVRDETLQRLLLVVRMISNDTRREYIWRTLDMIRGKDWEVLDTYFNALMQHYSVKIMWVDDDTFDRDCAALCKRYNVKSFDRLSPFAYSMLFTYCCNQTLTFTAQTHSTRHYGHNIPMVSAYDPSNVFCKNKTEKIMVRKNRRASKAIYQSLRETSRTGDSDSLSDLLKKILEGTPNSSRTHGYKNQPQCGEVSASVVPIPGCVIQYTELNNSNWTGSSTSSSLPVTNAFSVCSSCGSVTAFSPFMYGPNGFVCGLCNVKKGYNADRSFFLPTCVCCKSIIQEKRFSGMRRFYVVDDCPESGDFLPKLCFVCFGCNKLKTSNFNISNLYRKTDLRRCKKYSTDKKLRHTMELLSGSHEVDRENQTIKDKVISRVGAGATRRAASGTSKAARASRVARVTNTEPFGF